MRRAPVNGAGQRSSVFYAICVAARGGGLDRTFVLCHGVAKLQDGEVPVAHRPARRRGPERRSGTPMVSSESRNRTGTTRYSRGAVTAPGYDLTEPVREAILTLPESAWTPAIRQDGAPREGARVAEITDAWIWAAGPRDRGS